MSAYRQVRPGAGASIRADIVEVHIFRVLEGAGVEFLQLRRTREPMRGTWHPVLGHCEAGERSAACAIRELREEVGLDVRSAACEGLYALEQVHPFYVAPIDAVVCGPRFAARVTVEFGPRLNDEHDASRWISAGDADHACMWPGQRLACAEIVRELVDPRSLSREALRVALS